MNTNDSSIKNVFDEHQSLLSHRKLSRAIFRQGGLEQRIYTDLNQAHELYQLIDNSMSHMSSLFDFIQKGLLYLDQRRKSGVDVISMTAHSIAQLNYLLNDYAIEKPGWLPTVFREDAGNSSHRFQYFLDWSTVAPDLFPNGEARMIELSIRRYANEYEAEKKRKEAEEPEKTVHVVTGPETMSDVKIDNPSHGNGAPLQKKTPILVAPVKADEWDARLCIMVAKTYLALVEKVSDAGTPLQLSLEDAIVIMKHKNCHFTQAKLCYHVGHPSINHPVLEMIDDSKGAVHGNVVVSSLKCQKIKNKVTADKFDGAIQALILLDAAGLNFEQLMQ
jgi:hypothetical protein